LLGTPAMPTADRAATLRRSSTGFSNLGPAAKMRANSAPSCKDSAHAAPRHGEHNDYVLGELLGLSESERRRLVEEKVVY
jgi:crotonobetainyl-CoA:carnitine CoA-transferase CaiB-like acyl-CoA transferase